MPGSAQSISVIIPLYKRRDEIKRALASVLRQTCAPAEILVVDDASDDGSAEAAEQIGDSRIRVLRHRGNLGAAAARNTGIAAARGDWIALLDSDDEWSSEKLAQQGQALARSPRSCASVTGYLIRDYRMGDERVFTPDPEDATLGALVWGCPFGIGSTLLVRRSVFAEIGSFDSNLPRLEDWEWLMRYLPLHRLEVIPQALAIVHKSSDPTHAQVLASVARIRAQYRAEWYRRSWLAGRKFDSTLLLEEAAAAHYEGANARAAALAMRALGSYPLRPGLVPLVGRRMLQRR